MGNETGNNKKPSAIGFEFKSLEEFLKAEESGEIEVVKKVGKYKSDIEESNRKQQEDKQKEQVKKLAQLEQQLSDQGIIMSSSYKKKFIRDIQKEQETADKEALLAYFKEYTGYNDKENKKKDKQLNRELLVARLRSNVKANGEEKYPQKARKEEKKEETKKEIESNGGGIKGFLKTHLSNLTKTIKGIKEDPKGTATQALKDVGEGTKEALKSGLSTFAADSIENFSTLSDSFKDSMSGLGKRFSQGIANLENAINTSITTYANYQGEINARLQGSMGSTVDIFGELEDTLQTVSYSPLIRTETLYENLSELVAAGIASNVEQRAFLQTIKDNVATTFDANNSTLKRIIRLQQSDSTAARLGMEAYLTEYLNKLTENTEYLQDTFDSVASSLLEASSLMTASESTEFEYIVQKWLGTFTGYGLSEETANSIAEAIGQLGSGDISGLSNSSMQNLLVMASANAGLDYSEMLTNGLDVDTTNQLLYSIFTYLGKLNNTSSNVVKSQYAETFGVNVSDLVAAGNVINNEASSSTIKNLYNNMLTYNEMYNELSSQLGDLNERMGQAKILENLFDNFQYSQGANIASSPALYALWKITDMIQSVTGGINIPTVSALGNSVDVETTVENLMKLGIVGVSTLGSIGDIVSGISTASSDNASSMLKMLGIVAGNTGTTNTTLSSYNTVTETILSAYESTNSSNYSSNSSSSSNSSGYNYGSSSSTQSYYDANSNDIEYYYDTDESSVWDSYESNTNGMSNSFRSSYENNTTVRGSGLSDRSSGTSTSVSTLIGNSSGDDYYRNAINSAKDAVSEEISQAQSEENDIDRLITVEQESQQIHQENLDEVKKLRQSLEDGIASSNANYDKHYDEVKKINKKLDDGVIVSVSNFGLISGVN